MILKRLWVLSALAILPAVAQVSDTTARAALLNAFRLRHAPVRVVEKLDDGTFTTTNWSGYAVVGSDFTTATGSWIQPAIKCNSTTDTELAAFWVGIDGFTDTTVEQTGTLAGCVDGVVLYEAWYEFYPKEDIVVIPSIIVSPGDKILTEVKFSAGKFTLTIKDETAGTHFSVTGTQPGTLRTSAEWIAEAPCCVSGSTVYPIPDFGTALFGKDVTGIASTNYAVNSSHSGPFNTFASTDVATITMINGTTGAVESVPSSPSSDGSSFSAQWVSP
jgi:hypothetical protein